MRLLLDLSKTLGNPSYAIVALMYSRSKALCFSKGVKRVRRFILMGSIFTVGQSNIQATSVYIQSNRVKLYYSRSTLLFLLFTAQASGQGYTTTKFKEIFE